MGSFSDYLEDKILKHILGETAWPASPTAIYLALFVGDPTDAGTGGAEVSGSGYARKAISFGNAAARAVTQNADVTFDEATGSWGTIDYWGIYDASTAGNLLAHGAFSASRAVVSGNTPSVASGEVVVSVTAGGVSNYLANEVLDHIFNDAEWTAPTNYYAILTTVAIVDADDGSTVTEIGMTSYAPEEILAWDAVSGGLSANTNLIDFGTLTSTSETVEGIAVTDNATTAIANILFYDNTVSQAIADGDSVQIAAGDLDLAVS